MTFSKTKLNKTRESQHDVKTGNGET